VAKNRRIVEFGYEPAQEQGDVRGTLVVLDAFEGSTAEQMERLAALAELRSFARVVLFPHNEKTLKTMSRQSFAPFYKRVEALEELLDALQTPVDIRIDVWEEKRKKYTPLELTVRYLEEAYAKPLVLYMTDGYANVLATFASFEEIIRKHRLFIEPRYGVAPHPQLLAHERRWELLE